MHTLNRTKKLKPLFSLLLLALMFMPFFARADEEFICDTVDDQSNKVSLYGLKSLACKVGLYTTEKGTETLQQMLIRATRLALSFVSVLAVAMIIYGGLMWMTAAGSEEKAKKAQKVILMASIGLIVCTTAWFLLALVVQTTQSVLGQ